MEMIPRIKRFLIQRRFLCDMYYKTRIRRPSGRYEKYCRWYAEKRSALPSPGISKAFSRYADQAKNTGRFGSERELKTDMLFCRMYYRIRYEQYFIFSFQTRDSSERERYISVRECGFIEELMNNPADGAILDDKFRAYNLFREHYKRGFIVVGGKNDYDRFRDFCSGHARLIIKPLRDKQGHGVRLFDAGDADPVEMFRYALQIAPCAVEECIEQIGIMRDIHPRSVNTVRALTCLTQGEVRILYALIRVGKGNSVVDNLNAGGIGASIDTRSGVIATEGFSEDCRTVPTHPDSGIAFRGMEIPEWDQLVQMIGEMHRKLPTVRIIGWDLAYSTRGWCMVEGNSKPSFVGIQMCTGTGFRPKIERILEKEIPRYYGE